MNENAIKNYATWARRELMSEVERRCALYGISDDKDCKYDAESVGGRVLSSEERRMRRELVGEAKRGMSVLVERAAYTWFNRMLAIRFMECNDRLPSQTRMFSAADGTFAPQALKEALSIEIDGIDRQRVASFVQDGDDEALFRYLFMLQCDELADCMPAVFKKVGEDPLVLLLPDGLLRPEGVIGKLVSEIPEDDWRDGVQIVGWMYQFYISEKKDEFFASKRKASAEDIPAATQLFTPEWIVQYLVQNSLGRLWMLNRPGSRLAERMEYFIAPDSGAHEEFQHVSSPEEITLIDPGCGSGHILVYAFDLLAAIYEECGYSHRDIPRLILEKNLTGVEIDHRAGALASFALMMKACEHDSRFLRRGVQPKITVLEKVEFSDEEISCIASSLPAKLPSSLRLSERRDLLEVFAHLDEVGSLFSPLADEYDIVNLALESLDNSADLFADSAKRKIVHLRDMMRPLFWCKDVVVANPPYMSVSALNKWSADWVKSNYPEEKGDLFACFIRRGFDLGALSSGYVAMVTMQSWMFLSSFEKMREKLIEKHGILTMAHLGTRAFDAIGGEVVSTTATVFSSVKCHVDGAYLRLVEPVGEKGKSEAAIEAIENPDCDWFYRANQDDFKMIPGSTIAYWASDMALSHFANVEPISERALLCQGLTTTDNKKYVRSWFEPSLGRIGFHMRDAEEANQSGLKWFPFNKGGSFRRWYGNNELVVNYELDGESIKADVLRKYKYLDTPDFVVKNSKTYFREGLTWSALSSGLFSVRRFYSGAICADKGQGLFSDEQELNSLLAFLNSSVSQYYLNILSPTLDYNCGYIRKLPLIQMSKDSISQINSISDDCVLLTKEDWDAFETSWDFIRHPLLQPLSRDNTLIRDLFSAWLYNCEERFNMLKSNEEELNRIFARTYGMEGEAPIEVPDDKVSVRLADKTRDVKSLVSYAVGCMLGRYSLDVEGLVLANQGDGLAEYLTKVPDPTFMPDDDGIIPITDTEYFHDDATGFFVDFVRTAYGEETLEDNLAFVAEALGGSSAPREVIRDYFMNGFFADHCKTYQKRPIYWLFDSGKKGGFRALVYMHRYKPDLLAKLRTDYVHEQQDRYRTQVEHIDDALETADRKQQAELKKRRKKLSEQLAEIGIFEEKVHHLADQMIEIDLDDGVKVNYAKFQDVLAKIK